MVPNFIVIKYSGTTHRYHVQNEKYREKLFDLTVKQLTAIHPDANIHVLTNSRHDDFGKVKFHLDENLPRDNRAKFRIFGLIDEPAMYVDDDIIFYRPFAEEHMPKEVPFTHFQPWEWLNFQEIASQPLAVKEGWRYNGGIIWINKPSKQLVEELIDLQENTFNTKEKTISLGMGFPSSEYAIGYYLLKYNIPQVMNQYVNVIFNTVQRVEDKTKIQSVHYPGLYKDKMLSDYYGKHMPML
jgi:hypothetical protein